MQDIFFYLFSALTLLCGLLVVANPFSRNPVTSAMFLVLTIISMAGLFVLLDLKEEQRRKFNVFGVITGVISVAAVAAIFLKAILETGPPTGAAAPALEGATQPLGRMLFTDYLLPFEILSVLLLVAMVGVILLSKKELK